jgi:deoxyribose-phosphate aldolase
MLTFKQPFDSKLASFIDHTLLKPEALPSEIEQLCEEARNYKFASVCVNPSYVSLCHSLLRDTDVKVCTVIGFPLGATTTAAKLAEAGEAIKHGAQEVDMVLHLGMLKSGNNQYVLEDIKSIVHSSHHSHALTKVIIETCLLTREEKERACKLIIEAGADFVKTSTGFSKGVATVEDVTLLRASVGTLAGVKASGGIRTREQAIAMISAGANRIGTSSGVSLITEFSESQPHEY